MAKPFSISIVGDVGEFIRESGKVTDQLETIADGLEEMADKSDAEAKNAADSFAQIGDAADDAGKEISDGLEDGVKDAGKKVESEAKDMEDSLEKVGDAADDAGKEIGDGLEDGVKDAGKKVESEAKDMEDSLEKVGDAADDTGKSIDKEISSGADKAEKSTDSFADRARAGLERLRDKARDTGRTIDKEISDGADDAGAAMGELRDEAGSVGREAATSFSGEFEDVTDIIRDIAAEAFVGFGPAAAAAGMAAAAGIGLIVEAINGAKERAEEAQARFEAMVEALSSGDTDAFGEYVQGEMMKIVSGADDAIASMDQVEGWMEILGESGITTADMLAALAGDSGALNRVRNAMDETGDVSEVLWKKMQGHDLNPTEQAIWDLDTALTSQEESTQAAEKAAGVYEEAVEGTVNPIERARDRGAELVEELKEEAEIRAELAEANRSYAEILADQDDALADVTATLEENNSTYTDQQQLIIENTAALADFADSLLDENEAAEQAGITGKELSAIQEQNTQDFLNTAQAAGFTAEEARDLARDFGLIPRDVKTQVKQSGASTVAGELINLRDQQNRLQKNINLKVNFQTGNLAAAVHNAVARVGSVSIPVSAVIKKVNR